MYMYTMTKKIGHDIMDRLLMRQHSNRFDFGSHPSFSARSRLMWVRANQQTRHHSTMVPGIYLQEIIPCRKYVCMGCAQEIQCSLDQEVVISQIIIVVSIVSGPTTSIDAITIVVSVVVIVVEVVVVVVVRVIAVVVGPIIIV